MVRVHASPQTHGGLAQLARAPALHAGGQRFESVILHFPARGGIKFFDMMTEDILKDMFQKNGVYLKELRILKESKEGRTGDA